MGVGINVKICGNLFCRTIIRWRHVDLRRRPRLCLSQPRMLHCVFYSFRLVYDTDNLHCSLALRADERIDLTNLLYQPRFWSRPIATPLSTLTLHPEHLFSECRIQKSPCDHTVTGAYSICNEEPSTFSTVQPRPCRLSAV